ncbi:hypothetical protein FF1_047006 [Malus domestica]
MGSVGDEEGEQSVAPWGYKCERSSWATVVKQIGILWRSQALPRGVRDVCVVLSMLQNFFAHKAERVPGPDVRN